MYIELRNYREERSKDYIFNRGSAIESLDPNFGLSKHFISSCDGEYVNEKLKNLGDFCWKPLQVWVLKIDIF